MKDKIIDKKGFLIAIAVMLISWIVYAISTGEIFQRFFAAFLTGYLFWVFYILLRLVIIMIKRVKH